MTAPTLPPASASDGGSPPAATAGSGFSFTVLAIAGVASLGAGAIHAAAIGVHSEHQSVVLTFTLLAAFQLAWGAGALALRSAGPWFLAVGAAGNGAALVGWLLAKTTGIGVISGMEEAEALQLADGAAAALALVAGLVAVRELLVPDLGPSGPPTRRPILPVAVFPIMVLTIASMVSVGSHSHAGGHGDDHDHVAAADGHDGGDDHGAEVAAILGPFDPADPIDLSGVPGVTPAQQAEAEDLLRRSLDRLPQFGDLSTLNDRGYYSIGDGVTGAEHFINWSYLDDGRILDPDFPESLVIQRDETGEPYLAAAMFMLPDGTTLDEVPDIGGELVQWHVHNDLCFDDDPVKPRLAFREVGIAADQECTPPNSKRGNVPMVHVWIVPHPCGPFAALEGIAGGQVAEGEEHNCHDVHAHVGGT